MLSTEDKNCIGAARTLPFFLLLVICFRSFINTDDELHVRKKIGKMYPIEALNVTVAEYSSICNLSAF